MNEVTTTQFFRNITGGWLIVAGMAMIDGVVREYLLEPALGDMMAHILSGLFMMAVVLGAAALSLLRGRPRSEGTLLLGGAWWVFLIVMLEYGVVVAQGDTLGDLLETYHPARVMEGELILPGLLVTFLSLWLAAKLRNSRQ